MLLRKYEITGWFAFLPHLSSASALPCEIGNPENSALVHCACNTVQLLQRYRLPFHLNHAPNSPYSWTPWLQDVMSHRTEWVWVVSQKDWRNQAADWIQAMHQYSIWGKNAVSRFPVLPDSAEAQVIWCGIVNRLFLYFIRNVSDKKNIKIRSQVSKS